VEYKNKPNIQSQNKKAYQQFIEGNPNQTKGSSFEASCYSVQKTVLDKELYKARKTYDALGWGQFGKQKINSVSPFSVKKA